MRMIQNAFTKVFWWIMDGIATVLYGVRGTWRISRTPFRLVEKKYMIVKILTTVLKIVIVAYLAMMAITMVVGAIIGYVLVVSFFSSAESGMRNNF